MYKRQVSVSFDEIPKATQAEVFAGARAFVKREFSKLIGFLIVALIAVGLVFNAGDVYKRQPERLFGIFFSLRSKPRL